MTGRWTEAEVAAFVDGSLDPADAERVARAIAEDPAAAALAEEIDRSNRLLREAFGAPMAEAVPPGIEAALRAGPGRVVAAPFGRRRAAVWVPAAVAASLALVLGFAAGRLGTGAPPQVAVLGERGGDDALARALETLPSGEVSPEGVQPMLSFLDAAGRPCREFEVMGELPAALEFGIACRTAGGAWDVGILVKAPEGAAGPEGFVPASGPGADALGAMLDALGAGPAMTPEEERALLGRGWAQP